MTVPEHEVALKKLELAASNLAEQGQFQLAIAKFSVALIQHPGESRLYEQLAQCFTETEQYTEAYTAAARAVQYAPQVAH